MPHTFEVHTTEMATSFHWRIEPNVVIYKLFFNVIVRENDLYIFVHIRNRQIGEFICPLTFVHTTNVCP